ncbi:50S ribosomal protein L11 [Candidatus Pacearchaeota archaeon]|nr:50S ribosomal protein L11 [Candidatus Pacearchaeota archaeon]
MQIKLLVEGGEMKPGPTLSQKIGPLGLNLGKLIADVNKATAEFKGMKVPIILDIDTKTKNIKVETLTPPTSELIKKEMNTSLGSGRPNKLKIGNSPIETIIKVAKIKQKDMLVNDLKAATISTLGTCHSLGLMVEGKEPKELIQDIKDGKYDNEITSENEIPSQEKLEKLAKEFDKVKKVQDAFVKEMEKVAEEKAAAKAAAPAATAAPAAGTTPAKAEVKKK